MDGGTLGFLRRHREARVPALAERLVATILEQNPAYAGGDTVPVPDLYRSCHDNISRVLQLLALAVDDGWRAADGEHGFFDAARATGRRRAEQGMALDDVLGSFRVGGRLIWEDLVEEARSRDALDADGLREVGTRLWEVVDVTSAHVASAYHTAERQLVREDEQRRATLWEGLLHGRAKDPVFAREASRIFDLPLRGRYVVVALGHRDGAGDVALGLERRLALRGMTSAWQRRAEGLVGVLTLGAAEPAVVVGLMRERDQGPAGVSAVSEALADVDVAHRQAVLALRTVPAGECALVTFDECLPEALLLSSPDVAERLVRVWLRPVLELPAAERGPLLQTLETWIATGGSATRTAELAHCHRNTVLNRVRRVGALLGRELAEGAPPVDLALALRAHRLRLTH